jgi:multiple sugar transport system ATP-binding protein
MGDRIAVLNGGVLQQYGPPRELYDHPANVFVAEFIGSPEMNLYEASVSESGDELMLGSQRLPLGPAKTTAAPYRGRKVIAGVRPEDLGLGSADHAGRTGEATLVADVGMVEALGSEIHVFFSIDAPTASAGALAAAAGETEVGLLTREAHGSVARLDPRLGVRPGQRITFHVDPGRLYFFDPDTSTAVGVVRQ